MCFNIKKMIRILLSTVMSIILFSSCNEKHNRYIIKGKIVDASKQIKIYLKNDHTGVVEDSTKTNNGIFSFKGVTEYPQRYSMIYESDQGKQSHFVWLENTAIKIVVKLSDIKKVKIKAGREQRLVEEMEKGSSFFILNITG